MEFQVPATPVPFIIQMSDTNEHTRNFKRPFGVDKRCIECRAAKLSALIASIFFKTDSRRGVE
jgi:hypothetical protein